MTKWATDKTQGLIVCIGLIVAIVVVDAGLVWWASHPPSDAIYPFWVGTFWVGIAILFSVVLVVALIYWIYGLINSGYVLDRNMLIIRWGLVEHIVPAAEVERVFVGEELDTPIRMHAGCALPGCCVGRGEIVDEGPALFYGTVPLRQQVYVATGDQIYGISPAERDVFVESFRERWEMGPTRAVERVHRRPGIVRWPIWQDRLGLGLLALSLLAILVLVGVLSYLLPRLPATIPMHFDGTGVPDRLGPRAQIFAVPLIGFLILLLNAGLGWLIHHRERMVSYLLWGGACVVQVLAWAAAIGILRYVS